MRYKNYNNACYYNGVLYFTVQSVDDFFFHEISHTIQMYKNQMTLVSSNLIEFAKYNFNRRVCLYYLFYVNV